MIVSLSPRSDFAPVPRVEIRIEDAVTFDGGSPGGGGSDSFDGGSPGDGGLVYDGGGPATLAIDVPEDTNRVTVWRRAGGRRMKVRGVVNRAYAGGLGVQDMEAPFDVTSSYEVECFDGDTLLSTLPLGSVVLPRLEGERWRTLIQQPLNPHLWAVVEDVDVNVPEITRDANGELVLTEGSQYPSLIGSGPRQGISGAELVFAADTREVASRVWATLGSESDPQLQAWLIRGNHPLLPGVFFTDTRSLREVGFDLAIGGEKSRFVMTVNEIAPPVPGLVIEPLSYDDLDAAFPDYDDRDVAFPDYNDSDSAWEYAGAAG